MRIAYAGRGLSGIGGAARYAGELLRAWAAVAPGHAFGVVTPGARLPTALALPANVACVPTSAAPALIWETWHLPRAVRTWAPDVLVCPKTLVPAGLPSGLRVVSVLLDLLYFPIRGVYLHEYKWRDVVYMRLALKRALARADVIVCISECTRRDAREVLGLGDDRLRTVPLGVRPPDPAALTPAAVDAVRRRHGLDAPYLFYAGSLSPRKNIPLLLRALQALGARIPHRLVVTAGKSWRDRAVFDTVRQLGLDDRFVRLGAVDEADLAALYAGADAFVFPSLYEGFGLPVLEAMACGCPVICSNASALPEAAGDAALLVDPADVEAWSAAILRVVGDVAYAATLRARGTARAAALTWERCARGFENVVAEWGDAR